MNAPAKEPRGLRRWLVPGPAAIVSVLIVLSAATAPLESNDLFFHLASGRWFLEHGGFPSTDPFSPTASVQAPHEWVWGVLCELSVRMLGGAGPKLLVALLVTLCLGVLWRLIERSNEGVREGALTRLVLFGAALSTLTFTWYQERPYHLAHLVFVCWLLALMRWRETRTPSRAMAVILISLVWANLHGSWVLGPIFLGATLIGELVDGTANAETLRRGGLVLFGCTIVAAVHPAGLGNLLYPVRHQFLGSTQIIEEWRPLDFSFGFTWVLVGLVIFAFGILTRRRASPRRAGAVLLPAVALACAAFWSRRHAPFAGMALAVGCAQFLDGGFDALEGLFSKWTSRSGGVAWAIVLWLALSVQAVLHRRTVRESLDDDRYPVAALDALMAKPPGRVLAKFEWGGLVSAVAGPEFQTYIDSRNDPYPAEIHDGYQSMRTLKPDWKERLDAFHPDYVLWGGVGRDFSWPLVHALEAEGWKRVAGDDVGVLLERPH
ncbi:MAG: hypothetical protein U0228_32880 [Myxococcaceae bacterium]